MPVTSFVAGTLIRRPEGEVVVEDLQVGDLVLTSSGEARPVKWIGHRNIDCRAHSGASAIHPIRIAVDAFGANRPSQDLFLSPVELEQGRTAAGPRALGGALGTDLPARQLRLDDDTPMDGACAGGGLSCRHARTEALFGSVTQEPSRLPEG